MACSSSFTTVNAYMLTCLTRTSSCECVGATFRGAYLWKAKLQGSLLLGADFTGAEMVSAGMAGEKKETHGSERHRRR